MARNARTNPDVTRTRRERGTPEQAVADISAAIDRLRRGRPKRTDGKRTSTNLAAEAGMSRKQLYHYFELSPELAQRWRGDVGSGSGRDHGDRQEPGAQTQIRTLERELATWKAIAVIARAEAEHLATRNAAILDERERDRVAANRPAGGSVRELRSVT